MESRKTPIASFYCNLLLMKDYFKSQWFPIPCLPATSTVLLRALENDERAKDIFNRHAPHTASAVRSALLAGGLSLYAKSGYSNTVTVFKVPQGISDTDILEGMKKDHNIMLAGSFGELEHKGHSHGLPRGRRMQRVTCSPRSRLTDVLDRLGFQRSSGRYGPGPYQYNM